METIVGGRRQSVLVVAVCDVFSVASPGAVCPIHWTAEGVSVVMAPNQPSQSVPAVAALLQSRGHRLHGIVSFYFLSLDLVPLDFATKHWTVDHLLAVGFAATIVEAHHQRLMTSYVP